MILPGLIRIIVQHLSQTELWPMKKAYSIRQFLTLAVVLVWPLTLTSMQELSALEVIKKSDSTMRGSTSKAAISIQIIRPDWRREMQVTAWAKGDHYSMILVRAPAKEKGISFLKREKEVWNWIPAIERTIKLPPSMMSQSWMGTDFTNDDLVREASTVSDYEHRHLGNEQVDGKPCYKIEMIPKPSAAIVWEKVIVWVDKVDYLQLKAAFYDEEGELIHVMNSGKVRMLGGRKVPTEIEMIPMDKDGFKTVIIYNDLVFDADIPDAFFTLRKMTQLE